MAKAETIEGGCICGCVAFEVEDDFDAVKMCFCRFCQKASGAAHVVNAFGRPEMIEWTKGASHLASFDAPGSQVRRVFCSRCGSSLPFVTQNGKFLVAPVGSLSRPPSTPPGAVVGWASRPRWYDAAVDLIAAQRDGGDEEMRKNQ